MIIIPTIHMYINPSLSLCIYIYIYIHISLSIHRNMCSTIGVSHCGRHSEWSVESVNVGESLHTRHTVAYRSLMILAEVG